MDDDKQSSSPLVMEKISSLAKRRGFVFPGSEIYGGFGGFWDYGPLGVELKNNIKREWWKSMVYGREDIVGMDAAIIMNPKVWEVSGHMASFADPLVECKNCNKRFRTDSLIEDRDLTKIWDKYLSIIDDILEKAKIEIKEQEDLINTLNLIRVSNFSQDIKNYLREGLVRIAKEKNTSVKTKTELATSFINAYKESKKYQGMYIQIILNEYKKCPNCGKYGYWTEPKTFNLLTEVLLGTTEPKEKAYLRGEITQGVFVNFKNVVDSTRIKIPFGIAQIGKAFRNEITPGNFTFRSREFEQMEVEYFIEPDDAEGEKMFEYWKEQRMNWYVSLGMNKESLRFRDHEESKRAHYARKATDIEYKAPFDWAEFEGIHHRGDFDLKNHKLSYKDPDTGEEYTPWVIETSGGVDRTALFFLIDAYKEDGERVILKLHPKLAPYKVAVFPLLANKEDLVKQAKKIYDIIRTKYYAAWDSRGNIGKRYFAQDEIGTPWCVTIDFQTLEDETVTVRDRDTAKQERVAVDKLLSYFQNKLDHQ